MKPRAPSSSNTYLCKRLNPPQLKLILSIRCSHRSLQEIPHELGVTGHLPRAVCSKQTHSWWHPFQRSISALCTGGGFGVYFSESLNTLPILFLHKMVILILFTYRVKCCSRALSYSPGGSTCTLQLWSVSHSVWIASVCICLQCWHLVTYSPHTSCACFQSFPLALCFHKMCPLALVPFPTLL